MAWFTNMATVSLFWYTNMAAVTSYENALYNLKRCLEIVYTGRFVLKNVKISLFTTSNRTRQM